MRERLTKAGFEVTAKDGKGHMARIQKEVPLFPQTAPDGRQGPVLF